MDIEWIKEQLAGPGKSKSGLAQHLGIPNSAVTALLKGDRQIKLKEAPKIAEYFQMDTDGGETEESRPSSGILEIDVRAGLGGGGSMDHQEVRHDGDYADPVKPEAWKFPNTFMRQELRASESQVVILETDGDSMEPTIGSGERIIVHTGMRTPSPDGIFALRDTFGNIIAKRLQVLRKGDPPRVLVISDNKAHATEEVGLDEIVIVGRVLWGLKRL